MLFRCIAYLARRLEVNAITCVRRAPLVVWRGNRSSSRPCKPVLNNNLNEHQGWEVASRENRLHFHVRVFFNLLVFQATSCLCRARSKVQIAAASTDHCFNNWHKLAGKRSPTAGLGTAGCTLTHIDQGESCDGERFGGHVPGSSFT